MAVTSRFLVDLRVGPRTLEVAKQLVASVALACFGNLPLLLIDDHLPYPAAILKLTFIHERIHLQDWRRQPTATGGLRAIVARLKRQRAATSPN